MPVSFKSETARRTRQREKFEEPKDYRVILLNDDYTTMEFVIEVLITIFHKNEEEAVAIMLAVHNQGRGVVGVYTWDIARTKADMVHGAARAAEFPLHCIVEEA
jgi:ATP-dependent Clp protease adaptor protein ClpS